MGLFSVCRSQADVKNDMKSPKPDLTKYVWVDGVKGMDHDMTCLGMQYCLGEKYCFDGTPEQGKRGFHFAKNLDEVMWQTEYDSPRCRYFHVRGLVDEKESNSYGYAAKEIEIKSEIDDKFVFERMREHYKNCDRRYGDPNRIRQCYYDWMATIEDFRELKHIKIDDFIAIKFVAALEQYYPKSIVMALLDSKQTYELKETMNRAIGLSELGVSDDMKAYLLLKK